MLTALRRYWGRVDLVCIGHAGTNRSDTASEIATGLAKVRPFIVTADWRPTILTDRGDLRRMLAPRQEQLELFAPA